MSLDTSPSGSVVVLSAETFNALAKAANEWASLVVQPADAGMILRGERQSVLDLTRLYNLAKAGGTTAEHPYRPSIAVSTHLRFAYGLCNNLVPTVDGTPMDETVGTPPAPPKLEATSTGVAYLETVWAGDEPKTLQSAAVKVAASVPADDDAHGYKLLSSHTVTNGALTDVFPGVTHSLFVERFICGSIITYYWAAV